MKNPSHIFFFMITCFLLLMPRQSYAVSQVELRLEGPVTGTYSAAALPPAKAVCLAAESETISLTISFMTSHERGPIIWRLVCDRLPHHNPGEIVLGAQSGSDSTLLLELVDSQQTLTFTSQSGILTIHEFSSARFQADVRATMRSSLGTLEIRQGRIDVPVVFMER